MAGGVSVLGASAGQRQKILARAVAVLTTQRLKRYPPLYLWGDGWIGEKPGNQRARPPREHLLIDRLAHSYSGSPTFSPLLFLDHYPVVLFLAVGVAS